MDNFFKNRGLIVIKIRLKETLLQEKQTQYVVYITLLTEPDTRIYGEIYTKIRAIPGVTIVKASKDSEENSVGTKMFFLKIKFLCDNYLTGIYISTLKQSILKLTDSNGNGITAVQVNTAPVNLKTLRG